jgi:hypothetical protein
MATVAVLGLLTAAGTAGGAPPVVDEPGSIPAAFTERSYVPGQKAELVVWRRLPPITLRVYRVGPETARARGNDSMTGVPVGRELRLRGSRARVRIPSGPSGLYFARLQTRGGLLGFAPFVLRPRRLGASRVLVILPTNTWQAYNFRDVDRNGIGDTWYADPRFNGVDLRRPFLDHGVPPYFRRYDLGFLRWLARTHRRVDVLADDDLEQLTGGKLHRLYDLIVFSGHEEYVTAGVWSAVERFRDLGGNLAFLSANDLFYRVQKRGGRLFRTGRWRDLGRSEAHLIGARYVGWFEHVYRNRPYVVTGARTAPWLFRGTGLADGAVFGDYGIEVSQRTPESPPGTLALARIANIFGPGRSAEMTYYVTRSGAKVFSGGVINFGGSAERPVVSRLLGNLWRRLSRP